MEQLMNNLNNRVASNCGISDESVFVFLAGVISDTVATQLSLPVSAISLKDNLGNIGLSSLDTIHISQSISQLLATKISAAILYGHRNINSLVRYLILRYPTQTEAAYQQAVFRNLQAIDNADENRSPNREAAGGYIRSSQLGDDTRNHKYLILLSGSCTQAVKCFARKLVAYIDQFDDKDCEVLKGLELYCLFEHPRFYNRLAIVCEDVGSLKSHIGSYLNDKHTNCCFPTAEYAYKNVSLFANSHLSGNNVVRMLFEKNKLALIAYLWANQVPINLKSHYYPEHIETLRPQVAKIRAALFNSRHSESSLPSLSGIKLGTSAELRDSTPERIAEAFFELEELCVYSTKYIFASIMGKIERSMTFTLDDLISFFSANAKHARLIAAMAEILVRNRVLERNERVYRQAQSLSVYDIPPDVYSDKLTLFAKSHPEFSKHIDLLRASVTNSLKILSGEKSAIEVLFPSMSMRLVEPVYRNNMLADYYNKVASVFLDAIVNAFRSKMNGERITIIEIGAGTGGTSAALFSALQPYGNKVSYVYTDISAGFVQYGKSHYAGALPGMKFCMLDIESDFAERYNELLGSADIVVSANAVHATSNIMRAVSNICALLKPRGLVILNEVVDFQVYSTLTFGLLEGWWLYEDAEIRIPHSPLLSTQMWSDVFKSCGFGPIVSGNDCLKNQATLFQDIVVAQLE